MGKKITTDMIQAAYLYSKRVFDGKISKKDALDILEDDYDMTRGSASDCIVNYRKMREGDVYTRTNNKETTDYYLKGIYGDFGAEGLSKAIQAVSSHIEYYESLDHGKLKAIRKVLEKYEELLGEERVNEVIFPDEVINEAEIFEGAKKSVTVNIYERDPKARKLCIEAYGLNCSVCQFDFEKIYGYIGKGFVHVHHLNPIHKIGKEYKLDPVKDLRPVCPNCHAMLHKRNPPYSIEELQEIIANHNSASRSAK